MDNLPYVEHLVADRQAVARLKYNLRKFLKDVGPTIKDAKDLEDLTDALDDLYIHVSKSVEFNADGTRLRDLEDK